MSTPIVSNHQSGRARSRVIKEKFSGDFSGSHPSREAEPQFIICDLAMPHAFAEYKCGLHSWSDAASQTLPLQNVKFHGSKSSCAASVQGSRAGARELDDTEVLARVEVGVETSARG
jgi:hypothetical protein